MPEIFISYRRQDTRQIVASMYNFVAEAFGAETVYVDTASIAVGEDFMRAIEQTLANAKVMLVVIGVNWLGAEADGTRRIDQFDDAVRAEVRMGLELARQGHLKVIPVLVDAAPMPPVEQLPPDLADLPLQNAEQIHSSLRYFKYDINRLLDTLSKIGLPRRKEGPIEKVPNRFRLLPGATIIAAGVSLGAVRISRQAIILATPIITILLAVSVVFVTSNSSIFARISEVTATPYPSATAIPTSTIATVPVPTDTPAINTKGTTSDNWRVTPISLTFSPSQYQKGYNSPTLTYAITNLNDTLEEPDTFLFALTATVNGLPFKTTPTSSKPDAYPDPPLLPTYSIMLTLGFEDVPQIATNVSLEMNSSDGTGLWTWDVAGEIQNNNSAAAELVFPSSQHDLESPIGTKLTLPQIATASLASARLQRFCQAAGATTYIVGWRLHMSIDLKNIGTSSIDDNAAPGAITYDDKGGWYGFMDPLGTVELGEIYGQTDKIAPGDSTSLDVRIIVNHSGEVSSCDAANSFPAPRHLWVLLVYHYGNDRESDYTHAIYRLYDVSAQPTLSGIEMCSYCS